MIGDDFRELTHLEGHLGQWLTEQIWDHYGTLHLGSEAFEVVGAEEVPGYDEEDLPVLIRRKSDGKVFEVEIEPTVHAARTPDEGEQVRT